MDIVHVFSTLDNCNLRKITDRCHNFYFDRYDIAKNSISLRTSIKLGNCSCQNIFPDLYLS